MAWRIEYTASAGKQLSKLDAQVRERITNFLHERVAGLDDPRDVGEPLKGGVLADYWKYRVGDWRIIADIQDGVLLITVVRLGHRREVYRMR